MLYRRSDRVSSHLGPDNSDAYYEAVTDLMFSLSLLIARLIAVYTGVQCIAPRATVATLRCGLNWWCWCQEGGHGTVFSGNLKSIDKSQQIKRTMGRVYGYLIIL